MLRENAAMHGPTGGGVRPAKGPRSYRASCICGKCGLRMTVRYHHPAAPLC